jgi:pimeloyl-ACP methyl ester carboxylesterase
MRTLLLRAAAAIAAAGALACAHAQTQPQPPVPCPAGLDAVATCHNGIDDHGAAWWIAIPKEWNGVLVMHAHGGPRLAPIKADSNLEDLQRFAVTVRQGFAWAGSSYRRPGYGVRMAAEDTERLRQQFVARFGKPRLTLLHGQSWGGNVAAQGVELYPGAYDGVVLTNGMIAGGTRNYLHRADLRAVYQFYCRNHPRPDEPQYPLWMGLPADAKMTPADLRARVRECTGVGQPAAQRTEQQKRNLANILGVVKVPERTLESHLNWATFLFRDVTQRVLGGRNPFGNRQVVYRGSDDDEALNRGVQRFDADPQAVADLARDSDMQGRLPVPVLTMHAIDDPTALVEYEAQYRELVTAAGSGERLVQTFTREREHSKLADAEYAALFNELLRWVQGGARPDAASVAAECERQARRFEGGCHFDTAFAPQPLFTRVAPREGAPLKP